MSKNAGDRKKRVSGKQMHGNVKISWPTEEKEWLSFHLSHIFYLQIFLSSSYTSI